MTSPHVTDPRLLLVGVSTRPATPFAFELARRALRAAQIQNERIFETRPGATGTLADRLATAEDVLVDVHFYFVALRNVHRFLKKVINDDAFNALQPEFDTLNVTRLTSYSSAREAFEHIDQRLPGEIHEDRITAVVGQEGSGRRIHYGVSVRRGLFFHSDQEWDISATAFDQVKADVERLMGHVLERAASLRSAGTVSVDEAAPIES